MKSYNKLLIKFILIALLILIPVFSIYAADPVEYILGKLADEILPDLITDFAEGVIESRNQTELMKFMMRFWAAELGDERLREVIETAIDLPDVIAGIDVYDIVDLVFDNWEQIYSGIKNPEISKDMDPNLGEIKRAEDQVNLFKPSVPGPGVSNLNNIDGVKTKLAIQRKALDDHFKNIHMKYFDKAVNDNGEVVKVKPVDNSVAAYIEKQKVNIDNLEKNFNEALSSANISALLESINMQLISMNKTNLMILESLKDVNQSLYYLSIGSAYTNIENEYERQASRLK